jgi:hypothetical protein
MGFLASWARIGIAVRQIDVSKPYLIFPAALSMLGKRHLTCVIQKMENASWKR